MSHDRIDTDSDFSWPSGVRPGSLNRDSDIVQEALQRTKLHMTQAGITVSDDEVFEYLANAVAAAKSGPKPDRQDRDGLLPCPFCNTPTPIICDTDIGGYAVGCSNPKCSAMSGTFPTRPMATGRWNTRGIIITRDAAEGAFPIGEDTPYWRTLRAALVLPVEEQYAIAKDLAANCGYELTGDAYTAPPQPAPDAMREALAQLVQMDDDAAAASGKKGNLNGVGLVDLFDLVGHPFGSGEHKQQPYRSNQLEVALIDARAALSAPVPPADGALTSSKENSPCETINVSSIRAVISSGQATKTKSNNSSIAPVTELPENVRIPLYSLQADLGYLIGRVIVDDSCGPMIIKSIRRRLKQIEVALSPSATGAAEPVADERVKQMAARLIGYIQARPDYSYEQLLAHVSETIATFGYNEILNHRKALYATPAVRGDREAIEFLISTRANAYSQQGGKLFGGFTVAEDFHSLAEDVRALPVQPGADEREAINRDDVVRLVIAARTVAFGDDRGGEVGMHELDAASEQFASLVPWNDQPEKRS